MPPHGSTGAESSGRGGAAPDRGGTGLCHTGYPLDDEDRRDMAALQRRFGLELLPEQTQGLPT